MHAMPNLSLYRSYSDQKEFVFIFCNVLHVWDLSTLLLKVLIGLFLFHLLMNKRTMLALAAELAILSLSIVSIIGLRSPSPVHAQSLQSNQNGNTTITIVNNNNNKNVTADDIKQYLHVLLDGAIVAAQNNDTFGILMGLGQITEGLAAISTPSYFLFDTPLANNGTTLADTSSTGLTRSSQGTTMT
jgi:hypothetical protein